MGKLKIFTDGSTLNNQKAGFRRGGVGVFFGDDDPRNISMPLKETKTKKVTNQVAELLACIKAIENAYGGGIIFTKKVYIYTDSMYVVNIMSDWGPTWANNNWKKVDGKPIQNLALIKKLYYYSKNFQIIFKHVKAHRKKPDDESSKEYKLWYGNHMADFLATKASKSI
tara:strand:+ start:179 stop:685 length:507 start_codon:yes stop_codon:yes gene_type:complete